VNGVLWVGNARPAARRSAALRDVDAARVVLQQHDVAVDPLALVSWPALCFSSSARRTARRPVDVQRQHVRCARAPSPSGRPPSRPAPIRRPSSGHGSGPAGVAGVAGSRRRARMLASDFAAGTDQRRAAGLLVALGRHRPPNIDALRCSAAAVHRNSSDIENTSRGWFFAVALASSVSAGRSARSAEGHRPVPGAAGRTLRTGSIPPSVSGGSGTAGQREQAAACRAVARHCFDRVLGAGRKVPQEGGRSGLIATGRAGSAPSPRRGARESGCARGPFQAAAGVCRATDAAGDPQQQFVEFGAPGLLERARRRRLPLRLGRRSLISAIAAPLRRQGASRQASRATACRRFDPPHAAAGAWHRQTQRRARIARRGRRRVGRRITTTSPKCG